ECAGGGGAGRGAGGGVRGQPGRVGGARDGLTSGSIGGLGPGGCGRPGGAFGDGVLGGGRSLTVAACRGSRRVVGAVCEWGALGLGMDLLSHHPDREIWTPPEGPPQTDRIPAAVFGAMGEAGVVAFTRAMYRRLAAS